ncbi:MAG: type II toxin-antitoxin system RelE/ParE family toxin [Actinobacteria bacterium]|nr:MAG: type II toxin-antitoxin system RelE/ParE family toxin [Actinomycetota bacterium]
MAGYNILLKRSAAKELASLPKTDLPKVLERIASLASNPRPPGAEKLSAQERYRLRQGRYRIIYSIQDDELTVWIVRVAHRRDAYR